MRHDGVMSINAVNVLWTSGWDSTFRVADLALNHQVAVQPHYVRDWRRPSTPTEMRSQERIRQQVAYIDLQAAELILPTVVHEYDDIPENPLIRAQLDRLRKVTWIGSQYDWLSRMARASGITDLELCIHHDDRAAEAVDGNVDYYPSSSGGYHALAKHPDNPDLELFRPFRFPVFNLTKLQMERRAKESGFDSVMELTWFCMYPTRSGTPCGFCNPCKYTREEGLARRVPSPHRADG